MAFTDREYATLGARFGTQRMIEQAQVSIAVARAGRTVFASDPTLTSKLNLDILGRMGHRRKTAEQPSAS